MLGELIVKVYLSKYCDFVSSTNDNCSYDLILDQDGKLYRVEVKSANKTTTASGLRYRFQANRPKKSDLYMNCRPDIFALVFFPKERIYFSPNINQRFYNFDQSPTVEEQHQSLLDALFSINAVPTIKPLDDDAN